MTNTTNLIATSPDKSSASGQNDHISALKFITCGSVDDGKSTLIGRLLVDSKAVLQDHLAGVQRGGETDLALLTDGLSAEREQGITIDVAYRYFATETRKFIIGDAPGHEQYTRNMVTAASSADAAVVLVDATKLDWQNPDLALLPQTRRHSLLAHLLRVMFDPRITLQQQVSDQLKGHFGDKVFNSVIPRNVRLAEAPSYGLPGVVFDPAAKGSQAFVEFAQEMVERVQRMDAAASSVAKTASGA